MTYNPAAFRRTLFWLILGGLSELISILVIIWSLLDYEVNLFTNHPFLTSFAIAGIGFGLSLACVLQAVSTIKNPTYTTGRYKRAKRKASLNMPIEEKPPNE